MRYAISRADRPGALLARLGAQLVQAWTITLRLRYYTQIWRRIMRATW
jgi:hypothetical protein